ncbi:hypothetical protein B0H17DRAFT_1191993 [Mycena rosella]|uniref:Major facilitator superfamily (MFS) profile domain-containing protein n=1 Tax=Mycena rosella TaxID=1033263 RepID=A0AAD7GXX9_MYCRO|nr:hypothetical protein B0H17DRAFT_1191993 [Mycena rosella]
MRTSSECVLWLRYVGAAAVGCAVLTAGRSGIIDGVIALPSFKAYFGINGMSASDKAALSGNIVAILQGGCFVIQAVVGLGTSRASALNVLYFARFFAGLGVGMVSALVPSYVSECTPRAIRGRCTGMIQLANNVGIMISCAYALRI